MRTRITGATTTVANLGAQGDQAVQPLPAHCGGRAGDPRTFRRRAMYEIRSCGLVNAAGFNRRMRKTARPVVWVGAGAHSPALDPIQGTRPTLV